MKKIILILFLSFLLTSCKPASYEGISTDLVDGYIIYHKEHNGILCNSMWEDVYYSGETYNFGFRYKACSPEMAYFIKDAEGEYVYLHYAIKEGLITIDSLLPHLEQLERHPETIEEDEADYYWLDFHIGTDVVYAYSGGDCGEVKTETFIIDGATYTYSAAGCMKDHILYMRIDGENIPISSLIQESGTAQTGIYN